MLTLPRIRELPLVGSFWNFRYNRLRLFAQVRERVGDIGTFTVGPWTVALVNDPEVIRAVLVDQAHAVTRPPRLKRILEPLIGHGLLNNDGAAHRRQRKLAAPAFQHRRVLGYADTMTAFAEDAQRCWNDGAVVDVMHEMLRLQMRITAKTLFDADVHEEANEIGDALTIAMKQVVGASTALVALPLRVPTFRNIRTRRALRRLDALVFRMIDDRRRTNHDHGDFLSMLLQAHDGNDATWMTDQQVRDEALTIFFAGHETTATALAWTWYLLGQHPDVYMRLCTEVDAVLRGRTPTIADLGHLPYTVQVFKEALRLYPPVYIMARQVVEPFNVGDYQFPRGLNIGVCPYVLHRHPQYYAEPDRFDPERWTPDAEASRPRYAYVPFGAGPHVCIGSHFAMQAGHLILATLASRVTFELLPQPRIEPAPLITLRPARPIWMRVRRRRTRPPVDCPPLVAAVHDTRY